MSNINEVLISSAFAEMAKNIPSLAKFTILKEDEDEVDCRPLGSQVIKNFPWQISNLKK